MTDQESESSPEQENVLPIDEHEEIVSEGGKKIRRRGIYLLPNLLTLSALFAGFYAIIAGMSGNFNEAGWAIMIAAICDGLDGRIARLTNTQSEFGAQFDSLSDMVSFGVAPSLIMFSWGFGPLDRLGWAASFVFVSCAAIRLARFNVQLGTADKRFFVGLQSPLAAGIVTFVPWVAHKYGVEVTPLIAYLAATLTIFTGLLMISNYKYFSFKELNFKGTVPLMVFVFAVVFLVVVAQNPHEVLLLGAVLYGASGPIIWLYNNRFVKKGASKVAVVGARAVKGTKEGVATVKPIQNQVKAVKRSTPKKASKVNSEINSLKAEKDSQSEAAEQKPAGKDTD
ncbi:MAG: CDP-diacylglycerol--serine O-phosphatidyltransferase [Pseudohongiellaceae bacterium]|jgi:CDP-diacylglycerol--serine O-phosphatidyltransferase